MLRQQLRVRDASAVRAMVDATLEQPDVLGIYPGEYTAFEATRNAPGTTSAPEAAAPEEAAGMSNGVWVAASGQKWPGEQKGATASAVPAAQCGAPS